jgi:hypothetical protein
MRENKMANYRNNDPNFPINQNKVNKLNSRNRDYESGYIDGEVSQKNYEDRQEIVSRERENSSAANGLLVGILIASLIGLRIGAWYFLAGNKKPATIIVPGSAPTSTNNPTIIERTTERTKEVPVQPPSNTTIVVPNAPGSSNQSPNTQKEKTIINNNKTTTERTKEVVPASPPEVNVNVTQPTPQEVPANPPPTETNSNNSESVPQSSTPTEDNSPSDSSASPSNSNESETSPPPSP